MNLVYCVIKMRGTLGLVELHFNGLIKQLMALGEKNGWKSSREISTWSTHDSIASAIITLMITHAIEHECHQQSEEKLK